jgi:hypothetical protein
VFNDGSLYKAYNKRIKDLKCDKDAYESLKKKKLNDGDSEEVAIRPLRRTVKGDLVCNEPQGKVKLLVKDLQQQ